MHFWVLYKQGMVIPAFSEKMPKLHLHACNSKVLGPNYYFSSALKKPPSEFIQNRSQDPSKCLKRQIKLDKLDYSKNALQHVKNYFCFGCQWIFRRTGKQSTAYSFMLKYSKITVCVSSPFNENECCYLH